MKIKSSYEVRARRFIEQFYGYICDCHSTGDFYDAVEAFNRAYHRKVYCSNGCTRIAFITSDYVIKIDMPDIYEDDKIFGTCEDEIEFYNYAKNCGYEYLFAKIELYKYNNMTFYIMPRIYGVGYKNGHAEDYLEDEEYDFVHNYCSDTHNENFGFKNGHVVIIDYAASNRGD